MVKTSFWFIVLGILMYYSILIGTEGPIGPVPIKSEFADWTIDSKMNEINKNIELENKTIDNWRDFHQMILVVTRDVNNGNPVPQETIRRIKKALMSESDWRNSLLEDVKTGQGVIARLVMRDSLRLVAKVEKLDVFFEVLMGMGKVFLNDKSSINFRSEIFFYENIYQQLWESKDVSFIKVVGKDIRDTMSSTLASLCSRMIGGCEFRANLLEAKNENDRWFLLLQRHEKNDFRSIFYGSTAVEANRWVSVLLDIQNGKINIDIPLNLYKESINPVHKYLLLDWSCRSMMSMSENETITNVNWQEQAKRLIALVALWYSENTLEYEKTRKEENRERGIYWSDYLPKMRDHLITISSKKNTTDRP